MKKSVLFIVHRLYFNGIAKPGGIDRILEFLKNQTETFIIEHPFEKINHSSVFTTPSKKFKRHSILPVPFLWIEELIINLIWVLKSGKTFDLIIASDPLNFFSCFVLKLLGKTKKAQFHSTDYSNPRFSQAILEGVYQFLYKLSLQNADIVTLVNPAMLINSRKMVKFKQSQEVVLLPNSPYYDEIPKISPLKKNRYSLVLMIGRWGKQIDTQLVIEGLILIKKTYPDIRLHIVGEVENKYSVSFFERGLKSNVIFHGMKPYKEALKIMANAYIGITAYKTGESYLAYADSLKIREYAAAGLPSVCDKVYSTSHEAHTSKASLLYTNPKKMAENICRLIKNNKLYLKMHKKALVWSKENDKKILLERLYNKYLL